MSEELDRYAAITAALKRPGVDLVGALPDSWINAGKPVGRVLREVEGAIGAFTYYAGALLCIGQGKKGRAVTAMVVRQDYYDAGMKTVADLKGAKGKIVAVGAAGSINQYGMATGLNFPGSTR